jgi:hypothetical protein
VEAIDIDNAVTLRLLFYDRQERDNLAAKIGAAMWGGKGEGDTGGGEDGTEWH